MDTRAPTIIARMRRWITLRRWRLALAHTRATICLQRLYRSVLAVRRLVAAASVLRIYNRSFRRLYKKQQQPRKAIVIQAAFRAVGPRRAFLVHTAEMRAARREREREQREYKAATSAQAAFRGVVQRRAFRVAVAKQIEERRRPPAAALIQRLARGRLARNERTRRYNERMLTLTPNAIKLQAWWRVVTSEKILRKLRSVVDRAAEGHKLLVSELMGLRAALDAGDAALGAEMLSPTRKMKEAGPPGKNGGKRFEMWISLKVGLSDGGTGSGSHGGADVAAASGGAGAGATAADPAFPGQQVFAVRSAALKRSGGHHFQAFFSDLANVDKSRDGEGHYLVPRSWKHFGTILEYIRDGSCALPTAYTPSTYDNRPASTEEEELLEFVREVGFYGVRPLVEEATTKLLKLRYGGNATMLDLMRRKGLVA